MRIWQRCAGMFLLVISFTYASNVNAISAPNLLSPPNGSSVSQTTLTWAPVSGSTRYKIYLDDEPTVTSPYINSTPYYTQNTTYSPKLDTGTYYWKVAAQDSLNNWGYSNIWSFIVSPDPTSTPTSIPTPSLVITPTNTPAPSPTPTSTPQSEFTLSSIPPSIHSSDSFVSIITLSNLLPNARYYLKGAFIKNNSTNYFGKTKVSGAWVKNGQSFSSQLPIQTDASGNWSGTLESMIDKDDSGYSGSGSYIFKVRRYDHDGSNPLWSNEFPINITDDDSPIITLSPSLTTASILSPSVATTSPKSGLGPTGMAAFSAKIPPQLLASSSSVAGMKAESSLPQFQSNQQTNVPVLLGVASILTGGILLVYLLKRS